MNKNDGAILNLNIGDKIRIDYGQGNFNNRVIHVRAFVDDDFVVIRSWSKSKKHWSYEVQHRSYFAVLMKYMSVIK